MHLKHIIPSHTPNLHPNCYPCGYHTVDEFTFVGEEEKAVEEKSHEGPRHYIVDAVAAWGFVKLEGGKSKSHEGHHTVDEAAAWGFVGEGEKVEKEKPHESPHKHSIADLDIWRVLTSHRQTGKKSYFRSQSPHRHSIADLNVWTLLTKPSRKSETGVGQDEVDGKGRTQMHGNGGEICDSFFVSDLVGCAKVVNGKFRGGEGRKKVDEMGENRPTKSEEQAREMEEEKVMRKEGLR